MQIRIKKLDSSLPDLRYAKPGDAGFDLYAREGTVMMPGVHTAVPTGVSIELPHGHVSLVWDKSGIAIKNGLKVLGGVIDAEYRGEYMVGMINLSDKEYVFEKGDKVAQVLIQRVEHVTFEIVDELSETERGDTGFGSSGK